MSDENTQDNAGETPDIQARFDEYDSRLKSVSDGIDHLLKIMENTPKGEGHVYSNMGGGADPAAKSFGDFLLSIKRKDEKRLKAVYKSAKAMSEDQGATGGYLVPTDFSTQLIAAQAMMSPIIPLVQTYPVSAPSGDWPVLDFYTAPTAGAGNTAFAAQLVSSVIAEGGTFTDRNVKFRLINWRVAKVGDLVKVSSEMAEDAPALDALLRQVMTTALAAKKERGILRGTGVGEPLGILNAPAKIAYNPATSNVFAYADSVGMKARLKVLSGDRNRVRWVYHLSVLPDMAAFQVASGSTATLIQSISGTDPTAMAIWTYALLDSEHMPQADNDNSVLLADFGSYGIWQRGEIEIAISEDYAFNTDEITWRFKERYDGRPLAASSVTLADPQGSYTVSPFIGLTATHS